MATISEDYVSFETAKLLKEKGFGIKEETRGYYPIKGDATGRLMFGAEYHHNTSQVQIAAPTLQMACKWLREKYNIYISIQPDFPSDKDYKMCWCYSVSSLHENCIDTKGYQCYIETYEEACEAAIKYCLENLI